MYICDSFFDSDAVPNTHTHTLEKVTGTHTLVEGMGTLWVRVQVGIKLPMGYPCPTLAPLSMSPRVSTFSFLSVFSIEIWIDKEFDFIVANVTEKRSSTSVRKSGPCNRKKTANRTDLDRFGPDRQLPVAYVSD